MTTNQRKLSRQLEPLGYKHKGYDRRGHLVLEHPEAGCISVSGSPGDRRDAANTLAEAKRRLRFAKAHHGQIIFWLWERYDVKPGSTSVVKMQLRDEVRAYLDYRKSACDRKQFHAVYENVRRHLKCLSRSTKMGTWEITRPAEPKIVRKRAPKATAAPMSAASAPLAPVAPKGTPLPLLASVAATAALDPSPAAPTVLTDTVVATQLNILGGELRRILQGPDDRITLAHSTITQLADRIELEANQVVAEMRALASLLA